MIGHEELLAVQRVMESGVLSEYQGNWSDNFYGGTEIKALEAEWAEYFGVKHAIACNSATSGLWMALNSIGLKQGDEVIVSPYTMTCSASLPLLFGAKPVFADIEPDYFCIDPDDIIRKINDKTKAIIAVDIFGLPCNYDRINEIAKVYGLKVIEDAAQAPGAKYKGKYAGTLGDIGVYSLNRHKHIQCGEGGVVVTDDDELACKLRLSMNHAEAVMNDYQFKGNYELDMDIRTNYSMVGMNLRMTELSAAIAREQLKKLDGIVKKHQELAHYFPVKVRPDCEHSYYRYAFTGYSKPTGTDIFNYKSRYITPLFLMPLFADLGYDKEQCPVVREVNGKITLAWPKEVF
jgi:perosamine synthetase